jgi:sulfite reductase (NADPH) flavoprotein alpha-component
LVATLLVVLLSITGAILAVNPFLERTQARVAGASGLPRLY